MKRSTSRATQKKEFFTGEIPRKDGLLLIFVALAFLVIYIIANESGSFDKLWAHLIGPFDSRPEMSITEFLDNPEGVHAKKKELCAWAKREEMRNPLSRTRAARESACQ